ncbi:hypothetical protein NL526_29945, partial [Klebsiella pneumoniae]|nr:hypothetical protein [Klebsiella pneumoniae]
VAAMPQLLALDRRAVRRRFEERFSATRMAKSYENLYRSMMFQTHVGRFNRQNVDTLPIRELDRPEASN